MRTRLITTTVALTAAGALALAGCSSSTSGGGNGGGNGGLGGGSSSSSSGGGSTTSGGTYTIGFEGPLSGANAQLGINEDDGAKLAVAQANASNKFGFKVKLVNQDDQGDPAKSPTAANALVGNPGVLGVIGPSFSGSTLAVGKIYSSADLAFITPSATNATLQSQGFKTFHRIVPNDNVEGTQGADWMKRKGVKKLFVLQDESAYGKGVGDTVAQEAKKDGIKVTEQGINGTTTTNYGPIAQTIANSGSDAVFYGGYDAQAALLAKALQSDGFKGIAVGGNGIKSTVFTKNAGAAGNGWYITCGCEDATVAPDAKAFNAAYQKMFGTPSSTYSPEAYDATNALLTAIKAAAANGTPTRSSVETAVNALDYKGIATTVKFQSNGEVDSSVATVNLYTVKNGNIVEVGNIKQQS